jgi:L-iditol 2-dehydrogenase
VEGFHVGQRVTFNPTNPKDPSDILGHTTPGLFQQRLLVGRSAIQRGILLPLDERVPLVCAPLVEPLATVLYAHHLVDRVCRQRSIAVVGAGPVGLLVAIYARSRGCGEVLLVGNCRSRLEWAITRGIVRPDEALLTGSDLPAHIKARTDGQGVDAAYLCTTRRSAVDALRQALSVVREGGCLDLFGGFSDGDEVPELPGVALNAVRRANTCGLPEEGVAFAKKTSAGKSVWLTGHRGASGVHMEAASELLGESPRKYARVVSHLASLPALPGILETMGPSRKRRIADGEAAKVVIDCTSTEAFFRVFEPGEVETDTLSETRRSDHAKR